MAIKNDIAQSLTVLCLIASGNDSSATDYWTNLVRQLTHKAGLRSTGWSIELESLTIVPTTEKTALNSDLVLACGALKCLHVITVSLLLVCSVSGQIVNGNLKAEVSRAYHQLVSIPLFDRIFGGPDVSYSSNDLVLWKNNGLECLDVLASTGCLPAESSSEKGFILFL